MSTASYLSCTARQTRGKFYASEIYQVYGCTGATPIQVLADALAATGLPGTAGSLVVTIGAVTKSLGVSTRTPKVDNGSNDTAEVEIAYTEDDMIVAGYGPVIREFDSSLEQINTDLDEANLRLKIAGSSYAFITVAFGTATQQVQVTRLAPRATKVFTREETVDPEANQNAFIGKTNSGTFGSWAIGTGLCVRIAARNPGDGKWTTVYQFAKRDEGWKQFGRYTFSNGSFPPNASPGNGIIEVTVQGSADFNTLGLL